MIAKNALFITAFAMLLSPLLYADTSGMGDWDGQLFVNGSLALDGTSVCLYVNGVENDRTTVGAEVSGYYLLHGVGATNDNVTFRVFCEYLVNEATQNWSASPPRHHLNLSVNHSNGPGLTRNAPATTGVAAGTVTLTLASNESAVCRYSTTSGVSYISMANTTTTVLGTTHSWSISAPTASTSYPYYARCLNQFNQSSDELSLSFTTASTAPSPPPNGGGSSGGGSSGGSGAGTSTKETANYAVDVGSGSSCAVTITREMTSSTNISVLTTTLDNVGGIECNLEDFYFADTIPDSFPAINEITFNPVYSSREGWTVTFNFPTFAGGESKTITYSVNGWVGSSKMKNFTVYEMGAKKKQAVAPTTPTPPTGLPTEETSVWVPRPLPPAAPTQIAPPAPLPESPPQTDFTSLLLTGLVVIVVLGGIGGVAVYLKGRKRGL